MVGPFPFAAKREDISDVEENEGRNVLQREYGWRGLATLLGVFVIVLTIVIGAFLIYKGVRYVSEIQAHLWEFLGSAEWEPVDNAQGGGKSRSADLYCRFAGYLWTGAVDCDALFCGLRDLYDRDF